MATVDVESKEALDGTRKGQIRYRSKQPLPKTLHEVDSEKELVDIDDFFLRTSFISILE